MHADHLVFCFPLADRVGEPILSGAIGGVLSANGTSVIGRKVEPVP